jgi:hypothetical protein
MLLLSPARVNEFVRLYCGLCNGTVKRMLVLLLCGPQKAGEPKQPSW